MRLPERPPKFPKLLEKIGPQRWAELLLNHRLDPTGPYCHWDELKFRDPPEGLTHEEWWSVIQTSRLSQRRLVPLRDGQGELFSYCLTDEILALTQFIDQQAAGQIEADAAVNTPDTRDRYIISSLIEEATTSSQLEGAATTRRVASEMLRSGRAPRDKSEQMIFSNFAAMQLIRSWRSESVTPARILELHRVLTEGTLDDGDAGRLQKEGEKRVHVSHHDGTVLHTPPPAAQLDERLILLCRFANGELDDNRFIPRVVRAVILHFWLAYDHPFVDGNGRTARALFYWAMLREGYWLAEFVSISRILRKAQAQYRDAFLLVETDNNDLTYFVLHQLRVFRQAIDDLAAYLKRKAQEIREVERKLKRAALLNHRQHALVAHALRHPTFTYTIESHRRSHSIAYGTARSDLYELRDRGLLRQTQSRGRATTFEPHPEIERRLERLR